MQQRDKKSYNLKTYSIELLQLCSVNMFVYFIENKIFFCGQLRL